MRDPFQRYTRTDIEKMSDEEFNSLVEEYNDYVREQHSHLNEAQNTPPDFNSIDELRSYFKCRSFESALNSINERIGS